MIKKKRHKGIISVEVTISLMLLAVMITATLSTAYSVGRLNKINLLKQQCIAAARAQLDSIEMLGESIPQQKAVQLWPTVDVEISRSQGQGDWEGLIYVLATAKTKETNKTITVKLGRYIHEAK